jgi:hypothetical protein
VSILRKVDPPARSASANNTHHLVICCVGSGPCRSLAEGTRGLHAPAGCHRQILQVDRGQTPKQHQVRIGGGILHQHHPSLWGPELHHHRQRHPVHWQKVPGLLRGPPHPGGLGRRSSPHDEWAGRACQRYDSARTQATDLQRPQQIRQAMDEGTPLDGLESENDAKPSHGLHAVFSSLWGRGYLAHRLRIRIPEDEGVRRSRQPDQPRRLTGPAGGGSGHGLTTLGKVSAVPATLPCPKGSVLRPPGGGLGASATTRRPRAPQAHAFLGRAIHHRQDFEARNIQAGQQSRRGLRQHLEHPTATSLLPLRCFQVVHIPRLHTQIKSNHQGRVSLASAKPDPPSGARRGEPPLRQNFPRKKSFCQNIFRAFRLLR